MRTTIYIIMCVFLLSACEFETSDNGDLDGYWQWLSLDTLSSGECVDMRETLIFWAFEGDLLEIRDNCGSNPNVFFRFSHEADSLFIYDPILDKKDSSDIVLTDYSVLIPYAIQSMPEHFHVDHLSGSSMTLSSESFRLSFRKY